MMTSETQAQSYGNGTHAVLEEVLQERQRQDAKWGEQNHRDRYSIEDLRASIRFALAHESIARGAQVLNEGAVATGCLTWSLILLEEVFEALDEAKPVALRAELLQVAAVAVAWVEAIDRMGAR